MRSTVLNSPNLDTGVAACLFCFHMCIIVFSFLSFKVHFVTIEQVNHLAHHQSSLYAIIWKQTVIVRQPRVCEVYKMNISADEYDVT